MFDWLFTGDTDPEVLILYFVAAILTTIGSVILYRESRKGQKEHEAELAAIKAEDAAAKAEYAEKVKKEAERKARKHKRRH